MGVRGEKGGKKGKSHVNLSGSGGEARVKWQREARKASLGSASLKTPQAWGDNGGEIRIG